MHTGFKHPVPAVAAIILRDDQILLIKRGAEPGYGKWSVPGGSVEIGETLEEAVKREVLEETGLRIRVGKLAGLTDLIVKHEGDIQFHYVIIDYFAIAEEGIAHASTDALECKWVHLNELKDYDITSSLLDRLREHGLVE